MVSYIWTLLTMPVLGSPESEWLPWSAGLDPADDTCPWLSSWSVASVVNWILTLLTMSVLGFLGSEWLLWWAASRPC